MARNKTVVGPKKSRILDKARNGEGTPFRASPRFDDDLDRWSVAVRMPKTSSHFPSVFHFGADCFVPCPFPWSFGGVPLVSCGFPPFAMTLLL